MQAKFFFLVIAKRMVMTGLVFFIAVSCRRVQCKEARHVDYKFSDALKKEVPYKAGDLLKLASNTGDTAVFIATLLKDDIQQQNSGATRDCGPDEIAHLHNYYCYFEAGSKELTYLELTIAYDLQRSASYPFMVITANTLIKVDDKAAIDFPDPSKYTDSLTLGAKSYKGYYFDNKNVFYSAQYGILQMKYNKKTWSKIW